MKSLGESLMSKEKRKLGGCYLCNAEDCHIIFEDGLWIQICEKCLEKENAKEAKKET